LILTTSTVLGKGATDRIFPYVMDPVKSTQKMCLFDRISIELNGE
jgi:hypothetical protein